MVAELKEKVVTVLTVCVVSCHKESQRMVLPIHSLPSLSFPLGLWDNREGEGS